jgi:hypothetical protein
LEILLDLNAKICKKDTIKLTIGNERLHEISNKNGVILSGSLVIIAWHVLSLWMEETVSSCGGKLQAADEGWSSRWRVWLGANNRLERTLPVRAFKL